MTGSGSAIKMTVASTVAQSKGGFGLLSIIHFLLDAIPFFLTAHGVVKVTVAEKEEVEGHSILAAFLHSEKHTANKATTGSLV